jgi:hypothetical protein
MVQEQLIAETRADGSGTAVPASRRRRRLGSSSSRCSCRRGCRRLGLEFAQIRRDRIIGLELDRQDGSFGEDLGREWRPTARSQDGDSIKGQKEGYDQHYDGLHQAFGRYH